MAFAEQSDDFLVQTLQELPACLSCCTVPSEKLWGCYKAWLGLFSCDHTPNQSSLQSTTWKIFLCSCRAQDMENSKALLAVATAEAQRKRQVAEIEAKNAAEQRQVGTKQCTACSSCCNAGLWKACRGGHRLPLSPAALG